MSMILRGLLLIGLLAGSVMTARAEDHGTADEAKALVAKARTDCEGFAIFKLWLARIAGVGDGGMGILVGVAQDARKMHADLLVRLDGHDLILDNRRSSIVQAALMSDFRPWMVLDLEDLHLFVGIPPQGINPASLATESQAER